MRGLRGAVGYVEIVAGLQVDPELRRRAEVPSKTNAVSVVMVRRPRTMSFARERGTLIACDSS